MVNKKVKGIINTGMKNNFPAINSRVELFGIDFIERNIKSADKMVLKIMEIQLAAFHRLI
jgi:hypothetical protein